MLATICVALCNCQSLNEAAPPVATAAPHAAAQLEFGRNLYVTKCAKCHAPEPVRKYSVSKWEELIPEMAEETRLTPGETAAVRDYVMAVLAYHGPRG